MLYDSPFITAYILVIVGLLGLVMGSFVNCWAWRSLHGESVMRGRSHCTSCGHGLSARDLVPLASWIASRGRCRHCGQRVSARYPLSELACALAYIAIVARYGLALETIELLTFATILLFLSLTDLDAGIIPNGCIVGAIVVRVIYLVGAWALLGEHIVPALIDAIIGGVAIGGALLVVVLVADKVLGRPSMGGGDIKLFFVAGLYFGWQEGIFLVIVACVVGIIFAVAGSALPAGASDSPGGGEALGGDSTESSQDASGEAFEAGRMRRAFPFGPAIAIACVVTAIVGQQCVAWYLALL